MFECGTAPGSADKLVIYLGAKAAPSVGSHPAPYAGSYGWEHCGAQGCADFENDGTPWQDGGCAVDITVAPQGDAAGQPIAGTFSCKTLTGGGDSPDTVSLTGSFSLVTHAVGAAGSGGASPGTGSGAGGASGSSGTGGAAAFCEMSVSGAIDIPPSAASGSPYIDYGELTCTDGVLGAGGWFDLDLASVHGPGVYPVLQSAGYELSFCAPTSQGCGDVEKFTVPPGATCSAEITVAPPVVPTWGQRLAGAFSCPALVDAADPSRSVAVGGSFDFIMPPPPD